MTGAERAAVEFTENALPGFEDQTGFRPDAAHFSVVRTDAVGGYEHIVARPLIRPARGSFLRTPPLEPDPERWWVWDAEVAQTEGWIAQAVFTPDGFINHADDDRFETFDRTMAARDAPVDPTAARDPHAPVTVSIDLEEHEAAEREGVPAWEEHGDYGVLVTENGFAVVTPPGSGIVRYPDKTAFTFTANGTRETRIQAEKYLANRPYKTAMERVLDEPAFDEDDPIPEKAFDPPTCPAVPRAKPVKRVWKTVPITNGEDDD